MRLLETWVATPLAGAVGWALLHSLWEGAIIAVLLASVLVLTRSPRGRYAAACVAMLSLLGAFAVTLAILMPEASHGLGKVSLPFPPWRVQTGMNTLDPWHPTLAAVAPWFAPFWIAGVCIFYVRHMAGWLSVTRLRQRGVCCAAERWRKDVARLSARLRLSRPIALLESCLAEVPMVIGHFRPAILMPVGLLSGLPAGQIEAILLHELAHIRRCDYLVNLLQRAVEGLLFYHPVVWWISSVIRVEREHCCDDAAVAISGDAHQYATALAALEQNRCHRREPALAATGGNLMKRIRRLLYPARPNGMSTPFLAAFILIATAAIAMAAWQSEPPGQTAEAPAQSGQAATSPYLKWLNQDVVYIISDEERAAFEKLTTGEERDQFIKQFWQRRDPKSGAASLDQFSPKIDATPEASENAFKKEHYRRIAYANRLFRTASGRPGWQTDRGHMYIVYGPPDEIDSHPTGAPEQYAHESWVYRHIDGIGDNVSSTFVDRTGTGDYRLAPGKAQ